MSANTNSSTSARILVTGSAGFVGGYVISALEALPGRPVEVFAAARSEERAVFNKATRIDLDITDRELVNDVICKIRPTAIIHLAAVAEPERVRENRRHAWEVNFTGTLNLAESIMDGAPATRLVFASSSEVYGATFKNQSNCLGETAPLEPISVYGATKAAADIALGQMARDGLDVFRFRAFNHTGPGQPAGYVVASFVQQLARIEKGLQDPVIEVGNLDSERDFLDVRDVARAYVKAATMPAPASEMKVMNLASGHPQRIRSILDKLISINGVPVEVKIDPARLRPSDIPRTCGDASRAAAFLDWKPEIDFDITLTDMLEAARRDI